jgi:hypothetical protein
MYELQLSNGRWYNALGSLNSQNDAEVNIDLPSSASISMDFDSTHNITGARYAWGDWPACSLYSRQNLPALPFLFDWQPVVEVASPPSDEEPLHKLSPQQEHQLQREYFYQQKKAKQEYSHGGNKGNRQKEPTAIKPATGTMDPLLVWAVLCSSVLGVSYLCGARFLTLLFRCLGWQRKSTKKK